MGLFMVPTNHEILCAFFYYREMFVNLFPSLNYAV